MSPQVFKGIIAPQNDIYALGIVFHQVLAGWQHPSKEPKGGRFGSLEIPVEVETYVRYMDGLVAFEPGEFEIDTSEWLLQFRDGLDDVALQELGEIIRRMVRMSFDDRYQSALEVRTEIEDWRKRWLREVRGGGFPDRIHEAGGKGEEKGDEESLGDAATTAKEKT